MPKKSKSTLSCGGARILRGLDEALAWARGETATMVYLPGQPGRMMTRAEYDAARDAPIVKTEA